MRPIHIFALALLPVMAQAQPWPDVAEGQTIAAPTAGHVWFGSRQTWVSKPVGAGQVVPCTTREFGGDPTPRVGKRCRFSLFANTPPACWPSTVGGPKTCGPLIWGGSFDLSTMILTAWGGWKTSPTTAYALVCKGPGCLPGAEILPPDHPQIAELHAQALAKILAAK